MKIKELIEIRELPDLDTLNWISVNDKDLPSWYPVRYAIMKAIGATDYANWGHIGTPWSDTEMIGGAGTYMLRGPFGYVLLNASLFPKDKEVALSQLSVSNRGSGIGTKIMNALKSYADNKGYSLEIYKVTNQKFFDKFKWLEKDGSWFYTYNPTM